MQANTFTLTLEDATMISTDVKHFSFRLPHDLAFHYIPGQFITIHFVHEGKTLRRSYSIANSPELDQRIEFAAGYIEHGPGTEFLFQLKPGDSIQITGPFGRLILKDPMPKRYIFVSTSTGITPYRAMLKQLKQQLKEHPLLHIVFLQGVGQRENLIYHEEFITFARENPRVTYLACLSRESTPTRQHEFKGYVQHAFPTLNLKPEEDHVYLCGNPNMVDDAFQQLKTQDFPIQHIIREKYISR